MNYYNQNNYAWVPYPRPSDKSATVKSGGCGVCCASHIVEGLTGKVFPPDVAAKFSINAGARANSGTNMSTLGKAIAKKYGLIYSTTSSEIELLKHVKSGGMAIANVGGNRAGWTGVFSDGGHYLTVIGAINNTVRIYDSGYYKGKYNRPGRSGKVNMVGNEARCDISVLANDTYNRNPNYYLFKKEGAKMTEQTVSSWAKEAWQWAKKQGLIDGTNPKSPITREEFIVVLQRFAVKFNN